MLRNSFEKTFRLTERFLSVAVDYVGSKVVNYKVAGGWKIENFI